MTERFTPKDIVDNTPDWAIEIWNSLLKNAYDGDQAIIYYNDVRQAFDDHTSGSYKMYQNYAYEYRKSGWKVEEDTPGYNETYRGHWTFTKKKK